METRDEWESNPVCSTPGSSGNTSPYGPETPKPMSASLRERLKKTRRSFKTPLATAKRLKVEPEDETGALASALKRTSQHADPDRSKDLLCKADEQADNSMVKNSNTADCTDGDELAKCPVLPGGFVQTSDMDLLELRDRLQKEVREKTEMVRRLKMAKMYRSKNNLPQLMDLIHKWRSCSQAALQELQTSVPVEQRPTLGQLIDQLRLEDRLLHFDRTLDDFTYS